MKLEDIQLLLSANRILASTLELDKLLKVVLEYAAKVVRAETGSLLLLDEKTNELVFDVALGEAGKELKTIRLKVGEGIAGWVAKECKPQIVNDPYSDPRWSKKGDEKTGFKTRSILCVPMVHHGKLLGVVQAVNKMGADGFSEEDQLVLESFSAQAGVAIQNAQLFSSVREEKEKVETVFSQMAEGAIFADESGQVVLANPSACRLLGISTSSSSPHSLSSLPTEVGGYPRGGESSGENLWKILESFSVVPHIELLKISESDPSPFEAIRTEGKTLILSGLINKIFSVKGALVGFLAVFRDVTLEKKEEKMKRDFLSLMSHKLKTPLVAITGYTPMLLEDEELAKLGPFYKKAISSIHQQGIHLKQLVEKLISFSLIEAEEVTVEKKPHNAKKVIGEVLAAMKTILEDKKAEIILDSSLDSLPPLNVDYDKFREVMKSLIENGVKFNEKDSKQILISANVENGMAALSVKDNGRGIPPEEFEKIFQKFYQIEESFTGQVEGAGLGLALVKRLVEVHGGTVKVESKMGEGSTFTVTFPIAGNESSAQSSPFQGEEGKRVPTP